MRLIPIHNSLQSITVDNEDYNSVSSYEWILSDKNVIRSLNRINMGNRISVSNFVMNYTGLLDHKDGNPLNNQKDNLRPCTQSQNMANKNKSVFRSTSSKYKGVYFNKEKKKWHTTIKCKNKQSHIGYFLEEDEAALAYNKKALKLFGEFAVLNEID